MSKDYCEFGTADIVALENMAMMLEELNAKLRSERETEVGILHELLEKDADIMALNAELLAALRSLERQLEAGMTDTPLHQVRLLISKMEAAK